MQLRTRPIVSFFIIIALFVQCELPTFEQEVSFKDSPKQIEEARIIIDSFHHAFFARNYEKMAILLHPTLREDFQKHLSNIDTLAGKPLSTEYMEGNSIRKMKGSSITLYKTHFRFKTIFSKKETFEDFEVEKFGDSLKITNYNVKIPKPF